LVENLSLSLNSISVKSPYDFLAVTLLRIKINMRKSILLFLIIPADSKFSWNWKLMEFLKDEIQENKHILSKNKTFLFILSHFKVISSLFQLKTLSVRKLKPFKNYPCFSFYFNFNRLNQVGF